MEETFTRSYHGLSFLTSKRTAPTLAYIMGSEANKYRHLPVAGKHVLDIGGFIGDTTVLFHHWGARFVTVVEAVPENVALLQANLATHAVPHRLLQLFVGPEACTREVRYHTVKGSFGLEGSWTARAPHVRTISVRPMAEMLALAGDYEVVKCDCEGGEAGFLTVPDDLLRRASAYLIEIHGAKLVREVTDRFASAGFAPTSYSGPRERNQVVGFVR